MHIAKAVGGHEGRQDFEPGACRIRKPAIIRHSTYRRILAAGKWQRLTQNYPNWREQG
jgi:hypothetical protein